MMHVALLHEYFVPHAPGGAEWSTLHLARALAARNLHVTVITNDLADEATRDATARLDAELVGERIRVVRLPFDRKMSGPPQAFPSYVFGSRRTERYLARALLASGVEPDLYHVQGLGMLVAGREAARARGKPLVLTIRDYRALCPVALCLHRDHLPPMYCGRKKFNACTREYLTEYGYRLSPLGRLRHRVRRELEWRARRRQAAALRDADATIFVSDATRMIYSAANLQGRRSAVIHNLPAVEEEGATAAQVRERYGLDGPVVLFVGRWSLGKGAQELSAAWPLIAQAHPQAQLVIAGRAESELQPEPAARVVFTGGLPHADVIGLYRLADVVALPSRWPEPYSRVALEAMHAGKPVVATNAGGNPEQVVEGVTGYLVPRRHAPAFAEAVNRLLADPALARRLGEAGRLHLAEALSGERQLAMLIALYRQLLGEGRS